MICSRDRVLPDQVFAWDFRAEIADLRSHVAMGELEPGAGKGVGELIGILIEAARNLLIGRIDAQREVAGQHGRRMTLGGIMGIRNRVGAHAMLGRPLMRTGGLFVSSHS